MRDIKLGLRTTFRSITDTSLLRLVFDRYAPSARADWNNTPAKLPDELFDACKKLRVNAPAEYGNLIATLQDICDVCTDRKSVDALTNAITNVKVRHRFRATVKKCKRELQNAAVWMMLNLPEAWQHVLVASRARRINARGWDEYKVEGIRFFRKNDIEELSRRIAHYLSEETLHGEHVHIEFDQEDKIFRHFVSIGNLPTNVQQFTTQGEYVIRRDPNAVNFMYEYDDKLGILRLRCPLDAPKRRALVRIYADVILKGGVQPIEKRTYDLSQHLEKHILPMANDERILGVKQTGIKVEFENHFGSKDEISVTTQGRTNLNERICSALTAWGIPLNEVKVICVSYEITIRSESHVVKEVRVDLTNNDIVIGTKSVKDTEVIEAYFATLVK